MRDPNETNLERFDRLVRQVMDRLKNTCPLPTLLSPQDFGLKHGEQLANGDYQASEDEEFLRLTLCWLKDEGFVRGDNRYVITYKGMENQGFLPPSITPPA